MSAINVQNNASTVKHRYKGNPEQAFGQLCDLVTELARAVRQLEQKVETLERSQRT